MKEIDLSNIGKLIDKQISELLKSKRADGDGKKSASKKTVVDVQEEPAVKKNLETHIYIIEYDESGIIQHETSDMAEVREFLDRPSVTWINVVGLHQEDVLEKLSECIGLHSLLLEDICNTSHRPKIEDYDDYLFIITRGLKYDEVHSRILHEQLSMVLGQNFVVSFQEQENNIFNTIKHRILSSKGKIRKRRADYLAYALLDAVVDNYLVVMENFGDLVEELQTHLLRRASRDIRTGIHHVREELLALNREILPLRDAVNLIRKGDNQIISEETLPFFNDIYDHILEVIESLEGFKDTIRGMLDLYQARINSQLNDVMKVLTIISTIFMPLTFIVGIYGTNFRYLPELEWRYGYFAMLGVMFIIAVGMLVYFRKKKWL